MAKNLRFGASFIRSLLLFGFVVSAAGALYATSLLFYGGADQPYPFVWFALFAFSATAVSILISGWMMAARNLARRVNLLANALDRGAAGDLTVRVEVHSDDELDRVGKNFNLMLDKLEGVALSMSQTMGELQRIGGSSSEAAGEVLRAAELQAEGISRASAAGQGINRSAGSVASGVSKLSDSASANAAAILEMAASIEEVRSNLAVQSEAIEEVSASIVEMTAVVNQVGGNVNSLMLAATTTTSSAAEMDLSIKEVEKNAHETAAISEQVMKDAELGRETVEATISGINAVRRSSKSTFDSITGLSQRAAAIDSILSVIDEIAEQTNLLALNSAIIAAQAGEHGRGFAIVAGEIKGLANRTRKSTMEIAELIKSVQEETGKAVIAIKQTEQMVAEGELLSQRSGEALNKIVSGVKMATSQVNVIARTTVEQAQGSQSIHQAMQHVADMVAQIARSCQEQALTSRTIMEAVERMKICTSQVTGSAASQQRVGTMIAESNERMAGIVDGIKKSCDEQSTWSRQIAQSVESVRQSTSINLASARTMDAGREQLSTQINALQQEIAKLQFTQEES